MYCEIWIFAEIIIIIIITFCWYINSEASGTTERYVFSEVTTVLLPGRVNGLSSTLLPTWTFIHTPFLWQQSQKTIASNNSVNNWVTLTWINCLSTATQYWFCSLSVNEINHQTTTCSVKLFSEDIQEKPSTVYQVLQILNFFSKMVCILSWIFNVESQKSTQHFTAKK